MARNFTSSSTDSIKFGDISQLEGVNEICAGGWAKLVDLASGDQCINAKAQTGFSWIVFMDDVNPAGNNRWDYFVSADGNQRASTSVEATAGAWQCVIGRWIRNTSGGMDITVDGTQHTENAPATTNDSATNTGSTEATVGEDPAAGSRDFEGDLAFNFAMDHFPATTHVNAMSNGVNPFGLWGDRMQFYSPLWGNESPENNYGLNGTTGTVTGTTRSTTNPPVELLENYL